MTSASAAELLRRLDHLKIRVQVENRQLRIIAPVGALTPALRGEIADRKPELLRLLGAIGVSQPGESEGITRVDRQSPSPLSFAQKSLWFFQQLQPESPAYNIPNTFRLRGALDTTVLARCLTEIVRRHEALRTTFESRNGEPVQIIHEPEIVTLPLVDLTDRPVHERTSELVRQLNEEARRPFDLERGPVIRPRIWKLAADENVLLLNIHHVAFDGWSLNVLMSEWAALYGAALNGQPERLQELPIQYCDFSAWQRQWVKNASFAHHTAFWRDYLSGAPEVLELPTNHPRPGVPSHRGAFLEQTLPVNLHQRLRAMQQSENTTMFAILLTTFAVLLHRLAGQNDLVVGVPVANRDRVEFESLIGFFVNVVPIRTRIDRGASFRDLLRTVRDTTLDVFSNQALPFDKLVEEINPHRTGSHAPIFQVMFAYENVPNIQGSLPGLTWELMPADTGASRYDLTLSVSERAEGMNVAVEFSTDLFDVEIVRQWLDSYATLLDAAVNNPESGIAQLSLLSDTQRHRILVEWNHTPSPMPEAACLHQRIEAQVDRSPDAVAVVAGDGVLTYRQLDARANQLAHHLRSCGVAPDVLVGVYLERSLELVIALVGVLKAGGAYVPLDPHYPAERIAFMIADAGMPVVITQQRLLGTLPSSAAHVVALDRDRSQIASNAVDRPRSGVKAEDLAYAIYTSGSSGRSKGALIPHTAITTYLAWNQRAYPLNADDAVLQNTQFSFDPSVSEIFSALLSGARLVLPPATGRLDPSALAELIRRHQITTLYTVPSMLRLLLEEPAFATCAPPLRQVSCGGEALGCDLVTTFCRMLPGALLFNCYGPTEATIISTVWNCRPEDAARTIPIGRPIDNTRAYIVDEDLAPVAVGVTGELLIGGACLARGYLNRPELTAEKFVRDPFLPDPNARVYRTGDLARFRADGAIEFLGRRDRQVKLRGFRIELGEVESALARHPHVRETAVAVRTSPLHGDRLVAYVAAHPGMIPELAELRHDLGRTLPLHMLPSALVIMDQLPLSANGKVDHRALPEPPLADHNAVRDFVAPQTATARQIAEVWQSLLGVERVGLHDNFFALGGHSLMAMRAVSRLQQMFGPELALRTFFEAPTVEQLAQEVEKLQPTREPAQSDLAASTAGMEEGSI